MKLFRLLALLIAVELCLLTAAAAQETTETKPPGRATHKTAATKQAAKGEGMMPKPQREMEKLINFLSGTWSTTETYERSETTPKGGTWHGRVAYRHGPADLSLIEEVHSKSPTGEYFGFGLIWWDEKAQGYRTVWCDNSPPVRAPFAESGKWDGNQLVFINEQEIRGKRVATKEVYSDFTPVSFTQTLETGEPGGELKRFLTIKNTKLTRAAPKSRPSQ